MTFGARVVQVAEAVGRELAGCRKPVRILRALLDAVLLSYAGVPIAVGFAVLRYRLYDIDLVINRTLVYGALTAALALTYFGGVATTQVIFRALTGQEQQPQLAIVVSTLVIAALFNPLRRSIRFFIDLRFYRRKYDARKTLEVFSAKLRDETDLDALSDDLVRVVRGRCSLPMSRCGCAPTRPLGASRQASSPLFAEVPARNILVNGGAKRGPWSQGFRALKR